MTTGLCFEWQAVAFTLSSFVFYVENTLQMYVYIFVPFCKEYFVRNVIRLLQITNDCLYNWKKKENCSSLSVIRFHVSICQQILCNWNHLRQQSHLFVWYSKIYSTVVQHSRRPLDLLTANIAIHYVSKSFTQHIKCINHFGTKSMNISTD